MSRFALIDTPLLHPGTDLLSGNPTGPVVDTGFDIPNSPFNAPERRIYLNVDTIRELAQVAGIYDKNSVGEVMDSSEAYNRGYADAVKEHVGEQLVELVDRLGYVAALLDGRDLPDLAPVEEPLEVVGGTLVVGADPGVGVRRPRTRARSVQ